MAHIGIVKVRMPHDVEWQTHWLTRQLLRVPGLHQYRRKILDLEGKPFMPQLTMPYLAALGMAESRRAGRHHTFAAIDERMEFIDVTPFDMLWLTVNTPNAPASYQLAMRARSKGIPVVMGGVHPTLMTQEALQYADAIVVGEAEPVIGQLLEDFEKGKLEPVYRAPPLRELRGLPRPQWELLPEEYVRWIVPVQTSRGCRNACSFCSTTRMQGSRRRHRPIEEVVEEIRQLKADGILTREKVVFITDNDVAYDDGGGTEYSYQLFAALKTLDIHWVGQSEIGIADSPPLLQAAAESGCQTLLIGFESLSQENLESVGKVHNSVATYRERIRTIHDYGISLIGCFVLGFDHDTTEVFDRTGEFILENIDIPQISVLTPFPGTRLYKQMERDGRILHRDWSKYDITHVVFEPRGMTAQELAVGYWNLTDKVFGHRTMLRRALRSGWRRTRANFQHLSPLQRAGSVLAPNIIYRRLSLLGQ